MENQYGYRLAKALEIRKISQKELAKHLGIQPNIVSYWCIGQRSPNIKYLAEISKYLNVSTDYLLGVSETPSTDDKVKAACDYTHLDLFTAYNLHSFHDLADFVNFMNDKGAIHSLTMQFQAQQKELAELYKTKEELYSGLSDQSIRAFENNAAFIKFLVDNAVDNSHGYRDICNNILKLLDKLEYRKFQIQQIIVNLAKIKEEETERDFIGKHNPTP